MTRVRIAGLVALVAVIPTTTIAAQAAPAKPKPMGEMSDHHAMGSGWKELDSFHTLMAATWHPVAKSNDLTPIREKAADLSRAAETWSTSKVPAACDTKPIRDAIAAVLARSKDVAQLVAKQAADADVTAALKDVHTRFEVVEEGCKPSKG